MNDMTFVYFRLKKILLLGKCHLWYVVCTLDKSSLMVFCFTEGVFIFYFILFSIAGQDGH